jgi:hypothetical protein
MRSLRLGKTFGAVLIDAIMYMTTARDLIAALATARGHLDPDGALLVLPDCVARRSSRGCRPADTPRMTAVARPALYRLAARAEGRHHHA